MSGKGEYISPVRVSRLKKRRRQRESNGAAHQNLPLSSKQSRNDVDLQDGIAHGQYCKENTLNGLHSAPGRKGSEHGENAGQEVANAMHNSAQGEVDNQKKRHTTPCQGLNTNKSSRLSFIDGVEQSALLAMIPAMLGIDMTRYNASSAEFKLELERAFECTKSKDQQDPHAQNGIYHSLVGRIDPVGVTNDSVEKQYIAFPRGRSSCRENNTEDPERSTIFQHLNLKRKTEHGMCMPSSWYQFPIPKPHKATIQGKVSMANAKVDVTDHPAEKMPPCNFDNDIQSAEASESMATEPPLPQKVAVTSDGKKQPCVQSIQFPPPPPQKYLGKIRIESKNGATIREVFDIDKSNYVIGNLSKGEERYFIEKKTLPPPPISVDGSDDESEDECVSVVRYLLVLTPADCKTGHSAEEDESGQMVGWISDRGRLADDSYLILREV